MSNHNLFPNPFFSQSVLPKKSGMDSAFMNPSSLIIMNRKCEGMRREFAECSKQIAKRESPHGGIGLHRIRKVTLQNATAGGACGHFWMNSYPRITGIMNGFCPNFLIKSHESRMSIRLYVSLKPDTWIAHPRNGGSHFLHFVENGQWIVGISKIFEEFFGIFEDHLPVKKPQSARAHPSFIKFTLWIRFFLEYVNKMNGVFSDIKNDFIRDTRHVGVPIVRIPRVPLSFLHGSQLHACIKLHDEWHHMDNVESSYYYIIFIYLKDRRKDICIYPTSKTHQFCGSEIYLNAFVELLRKVPEESPKKISWACWIVRIHWGMIP